MIFVEIFCKKRKSDAVSLPEQDVFALGTENFSGLYVTESGGKELQLDGYTLRYNSAASGKQTVVVEYKGEEASFDILFYNDRTERVLDFGSASLGAGEQAYAALFSGGKMLSISPVVELNGSLRAVVSVAAHDSADRVQLFRFANGSCVPVGTPIAPQQ